MNKRQKIVQQAFLDNEEAIIKRLKQVYGQSLKDINAEAQKLHDEFEELKAEYDTVEDEAEREILKSRMQSKVYQKQYQESLKKQVGDILDTMKEKEFTTVSDYLNKCYEEAFVGTMYDLQGQGIPLCFPLDQEAMVRAVQLDSKISQGLYSRLGEDVSLLKKKITAQVSRGISTGMSYQQVAQQLAGYTNIGFNNAVRIARTEGHRIQCQSGMDACYKAKEKGADVVKQWDSTLDVKTRSSHVDVDGEIKELNERFSNGLMFPGDPSGRPEEVINCRCALLQRARWAVGGSFTKMNNFSKQLETFEKPEDYAEFKKGFFSKENKKYMKFVEKMENRHETKNFHRILEKMSDNEYKHYSTMIEENPLFNKQETFRMLNLEEFQDMQHSITSEEKSIVYGKGHFSGYINSRNARIMNNMMRNNEPLPADYQNIANTLQKIIDKNTIPDDIIVVRYVKFDALESIAGVKAPIPTLKKTAAEYFKEFDEIPSLIEKGHIYTEKAFLSTSGVFDNNVMQTKGIQLNIKAPKGTPAYITTNNKESEIIFGKKTKLKIQEARIEGSGTADHKIVLDCIIVK